MTLWWYFRSFTFKSRCQIEPLVTIPTHESCLLFDLNYFSVRLCGVDSCLGLSSLDVTMPTHESCLLFDSKLLFSMTLWWYFKSCTFKSRCQIEPLVTIPTHKSRSLFDSKLLFSMTLWYWFMSWTFKSRCQIEPLVTIPTHETCLLYDSKLLFSMTLWWYFMSCH